MNALPDKSIIEEVAQIKAINAAFVEKDWYVTQVIRKVSEFHFEDFQIVFTGGTALSKAHSLIQRFSEDTDFRVITPSLSNESKSKQSRILSAFKKALIADFKTEFQVNEEQIFARNGNQFVGIELNYPTLFIRSEVLRPHILIEFTITSLSFPAIFLPVSSFINQLSGKTPEVETIGCTDPVENASDKLSAITWRIPERVKGQDNDDPNIVRHIHDLSILSDLAVKHPGFKQLAQEIINRDDYRSKKLKGFSIKKKFDTVLDILNNEPEYSREYDRFVKGMSYAPDGSILSFQQAMGKVRGLIEHILLP